MEKDKKIQENDKKWKAINSAVVIGAVVIVAIVLIAIFTGNHNNESAASGTTNSSASEKISHTEAANIVKNSSAVESKIASHTSFGLSDYMVEFSRCAAVDRDEKWDVLIQGYCTGIIAASGVEKKFPFTGHVYISKQSGEILEISLN